MLKITNLNKTFGELKVLKGIDVTIETNETVAILGPSGSGKTTLLRCINYLEQPEQGILEIDNFKVNFESITKEEIVYLRRNSSMVFQQYNLFANKTALENIKSGLTIPRKVKSSEAETIARELLDKVGLSNFADYYPAQLSGGQQQRIGIARALAINPRVILFDEPTSALDPELVSEVLSIIRDISDDSRTSIIVTHEIGFAYDIADKIIFMADGQVVEVGTPDEVIKHPKKERTKNFLAQTRKQVENLLILD